MDPIHARTSQNRARILTNLEKQIGIKSLTAYFSDPRWAQSRADFLNNVSRYSSLMAD